MTDAYTMYDAAYLLGALTPQDRAAYEEHLTTCLDCRRAVSASAGLPGLLANVSADDVERATAELPDVPETLLPKLLAEVERSRFRRRTLTSLLGVAAAAVLVLGVVVGIKDISGGATHTSTTQASGFQHLTALRVGVPITAAAKLDAKAWGTQVTLRCTYDVPASVGGLHYQQGAAPTYTMVVTDTSGHVQQIAAWEAKPGAPITVDGMTSLPRSRIASIEVRDTQRHPVLRLSL